VLAAMTCWAPSGRDARLFLLPKAKKIGFEAIDVAFDPVDQPPEAVRQFTDDVRAVGLSARSVVCVSLGFAGDYNASVQRFHVERVKRHLDLAAELGARNLLLVIGEYIWGSKKLSRPRLNGRRPSETHSS
jgi:D-psicose/D-tagatose/L-ribulose 3-epimerase